MSTLRHDLQPIIATTDGSRVYCSTGEVLPLTMPTDAPWSAGSLAEACARRHITQLWIVPAPELALADGVMGWDFRAETDDRAPAGWAHGFRKGTNLEVALVRPGLDRNSPFWDAPDARTLLAALLRFRELLGMTFHHSASATSRELLVELHHGHRKNIPLRGVPMPPPALDIMTEAPLSWMLPAEAIRALPAFQYVHSFDKNGAYLGAAYGLNLGAGRVDHLTGQPGGKDGELPGYFRIVPPAAEDGLPSFAAARAPRGGESDGTRWVTTPTLAYLTERYTVAPAIREAYVWREHHQPLAPWYKVLRDARATLQEERGEESSRLVLAAVKASYTTLLTGYLASTKENWDRSKDVLYRPDIRHQIIAKARCTLLRTAQRCQENGATILGVNGVDTLYILSNEPDAAAAAEAITMHLGAALPNYKVKDSWELTPQLRASLEREGLTAGSRFTLLDDSTTARQEVAL